MIKTVAHLALGIYMLWSNIKVSLHMHTLLPICELYQFMIAQRDKEQGKVMSYDDQLKGEGDICSESEAILT